VNRGATCSYNAGIDWARSEYFLILDADDLLAPKALARAVRILDANPEVSFVHGVEDSLHSDGVHVLPYTDDLEMWLRLAMLGSVVTIRAPQAIRRLHKARMSTGYQSLRDFRERERAFESFFRTAGAALPDADILMAAVRRGLGQHAYWSGLSHLLRGQLSDARDLLGLAHRELPLGGVVPPVAWLLRTDRPFARALAVLSERFGRPHAGASRRRRGQGVGAGLS
jgi:glycosyltransferase involved in cell wall biosynthesis